MKFSIKDFFSKCDKIRRFLLIWSYLLKKFLMENSFFVQCLYWDYVQQFNKQTFFIINIIFMTSDVPAFVGLP